MLTYRTLVRTVAPPVLALGLTALMVHPIEAVQAAPAPASPAAPAPAAMLDARVGAPASGSTVSVSVPAVAFQQHATLSAGRLRTAVLVNVAEPAGTASVDGIAGCTAAATPGVPAWLDCAVPAGSTFVSVRVALADGRVFLDSQVPIVTN